MSKVHRMNEDSREANSNLYHIRNLTREPHNVADKIVTKAVNRQVVSNVYSFNAGLGHIATYVKEPECEPSQNLPARVTF